MYIVYLTLLSLFYTTFNLVSDEVIENVLMLFVLFFFFSIDGEFVPKEGDDVTFKLIPLPFNPNKKQAVHVKITHLAPGVTHETWNSLSSSPTHSPRTWFTSSVHVFNLVETCTQVICKFATFFLKTSENGWYGRILLKRFAYSKTGVFALFN